MSKPIIDQPKSRCDACQSTERTGYTNTETKQIEGIRDGQPYNRVVWRRCSCINCGKHRVDKSFEFVPTKPHGQSKKENSEVRGNSSDAELPEKKRPKNVATSLESGTKSEQLQKSQTKKKPFKKKADKT